MSHFLRNITALQDLSSPVRHQGGPQIPRLPGLSLAPHHHHSSASLETSVSFIINGYHMKRWGKTPQESQHENGLEEPRVETEWSCEKGRKREMDRGAASDRLWLDQRPLLKSGAVIRREARRSVHLLQRERSDSSGRCGAWSRSCWGSGEPTWLRRTTVYCSDCVPETRLVSFPVDINVLTI